MAISPTNATLRLT